MAPPRLRSFLRKLRKDFPTRLPVRVRQKRLIDREGNHYHGCTWKRENAFEIWIHAASPEAMAKDCLLHEYAHVLTWSEPLHHSAKWAAKYAELQRWVSGETEWAS